jgi:glycosyltransferase involved in cell wall biosynthesis
MKTGGTSIIVLAFNEEKNLIPTVTSITSELKNIPDDYEIVIVNDGSTDKTGSVADKLAKKYPRVKVLHHPRNLGFGRTFKDGVDFATKEYVVGFPGDNDTSPGILKDLIMMKNSADLVISYPKENNLRTKWREFVSGFFVKMMNLIFTMNLKYYNGSFICKTKILQDLHLESKGFAIYAEAKVRLIKRGYSFKETPFTHIGRKYGHSKAVNIKSVGHTLNTIIYLVNRTVFQNQ